MHSYILTGLRMGPLMKLLRRHGFTPSPRNLGRLLFVMQNAAWASLFSWQERRKFVSLVSEWPDPDDPVIIVGHWRTGSTYLHLLMSQDQQFIAPSLFQTAFPDCFLTAEKYYRPIMGRLVNKRPMDHVRLGFDDAQEDEFALLKLTQDSPLMDIPFPYRKGYFINHYDDFNPLPDKFQSWKNSLITFCKKVRGNSGRTLLLKNPAHSLRIPALLETFPRARFIHIHRHPYHVVSSSVNLWKVLINDNLLKGRPEYPTVQEVARGLSRFYDIIRRDLAGLPDNRKSEVAYEDLVASPKAELRKIYAGLGLQFSAGFESRADSFEARNKDFKKNSYTFDASDREVVLRVMERHFEHYHYTR